MEGLVISHEGSIPWLRLCRCSEGLHALIVIKPSHCKSVLNLRSSKEHVCYFMDSRAKMLHFIRCHSVGVGAV